eukprot:3170191-Amphidinium_carterae.1
MKINRHQVHQVHRQREERQSLLLGRLMDEAPGMLDQSRSLSNLCDGAPHPSGKSRSVGHKPRADVEATAIIQGVEGLVAQLEFTCLCKAAFSGRMVTYAHLGVSTCISK